MAAGEFQESSPLLRDSSSVTSTPDDSATRKKNNRTIGVILFTNLLASSAGGFLTIPTARLVEDALCRQYYTQAHQDADSPIDELMCKEQAIQSRLAFVIATQSALIAGVSLLAALPWSMVADRIGRKPVLMLCLTGITIGAAITLIVLWFRDIFAVELIWLEAASQIIGGGNPVAIGLLMSIIADATTEEARAVVFMRQYTVSACGNLLAPTVSSIIMARFGPWPPAFIGLVLFMLSVVGLAFVPETLARKPSQNTGGSAEHRDNARSSQVLASKVRQLVARLRESLSILRTPALVMLLVACLGTAPVIRSTCSFMALFLSKRYGIQLYQAGYVQSAFGLVQCVQTLLVLPWLSRRLLRPSSAGQIARFPGEHHRDLALLRWSACITGVAALLLGLAPTLAAFLLGLAVLAAGVGTSSLLRSVMSLHVDPEHRSRLFGLTGMVEIVGSIYAQPMLAGLFSLGMKLGGGWIGLPYYGLACIVALVLTLLIFVRVPKEAQETVCAEEDD